MPLFQTVRRVKRWPVALPLHDGRRCPDCHAIVIGDRGQQLHRAHHVAQRKWQEQVIEAIRQTAAGAGLTVGEAPSGGEVDGLERMPDDELESSRPVSWHALTIGTADYEDDDDER